MASSAGGVDIEEVARETPEKILRLHLDQRGLPAYRARAAARFLDPRPPVQRQLVAVLDRLNPMVRKTTDRHLDTPWKLLVGGRVVLEQPRYEVIADTFTHLAHHRGQLTVYLRLNGANVPSVYGPSADDARF